MQMLMFPVTVVPTPDSSRLRAYTQNTSHVAALRHLSPAGMYGAGNFSVSASFASLVLDAAPTDASFYWPLQYCRECVFFVA